MLADDVIAAVGGKTDGIFEGAVSLLAEDIKRAARYDLSPGVMRSATTVHHSQQAVRMKALPLCRLPFQRTWFEWHGNNGEPFLIQGPKRHAPTPRRCGAMVTVDESRQRGTMSWAWFTKEHGQGVNLCPLAVSFDWREEPEPIPDLIDAAFQREGLDRHASERAETLVAQQMLPRLQRIEPAALEADRDRVGIVWSPHFARFAEGYERDMGPIDPRHKLWQYSLGDITGEPGMLQCVIMLLNSRNMTASNAVPAPDKLNKQRARNGKRPLLDYTTINIKLSRALSQRTGAPGERSASRIHVVAGHFKVRKSGIYWWNDHARGDPTQGVVRQQTRVVNP